MSTSTAVALTLEVWQELERAHYERALRFTADHRARRQRQEKHPVIDFLFDYYPFRPAQLERWHPGFGVVLIDAHERAHWRGYRLLSEISPRLVGVDAPAWCRRHERMLSSTVDLLTSTASNPTHFDCFGLHEWAMLYRSGETRHDLPLRLGQQGTDEVVEKHQLKCTHYDAYRFFTAPARPLNLTVLDRSTQPDNDQPGCLHATMDLYKWAAKCGPLIPGRLLLDAFELALDTRILDMEASPYDVRGLGYGVVAIETPEGKAEYVRRQRELSARGSLLRRELIAVLSSAMSAAPQTSYVVM